MGPKKIARIEHNFKLQIPAGKAFLEKNKLYPEESVSKSPFFKYYQKLRKGEPVYKRNFSPGGPRSIDDERLHKPQSIYDDPGAGQGTGLHFFCSCQAAPGDALRQQVVCLGPP